MKSQSFRYRFKRWNQKHWYVPSLCFTVLLSFAVYFFNNSPVFTGDNAFRFRYRITQRFKEKLPDYQPVSYDDAVFVNVAYDKVMIDTYSKTEKVRPKSIGKTPITDREKLYHFLKYLKVHENYKYIIMDIGFDRNDRTEYDDSLFNLILNMDRIVVANSDHIEINPLLKEKSAIAQYRHVGWDSDFIRYEYTYRGEPYIPTKVYEELNPGKGLRKGLGWGPFAIYTKEGRLAQNSCFLVFDSNEMLYDNVENYYRTNLLYRNLGSDFLSLPGTESELTDRICKETEGKYIFIGDMITDVHDTYMGERPGCLILYRALQSLEEGKNIVSWMRWLAWFAVLFLLTDYVLHEEYIWNHFGKKRKSRKKRFKFFRFCMTLLSFPVILYSCSWLDYLIFGNVVSTIAPIFLLTVINLYKKYQVI